jgi:transmembrane sensor
VLQVSLRDGLMHAARHTAFGLHPNKQADTVFLHSGLAAFHLWRNAAAPTHVTTTLGEIFAAAARFYVLILDSLVEITVAEGRVRVRSSLLNAEEVVVNAGQKLTLRPGGVLVQPIGLTHAERGFAWTKGYFDFDGETLGEAAAAFNRFNDLQIVLTPKAAGLVVASSRSPLNNPERFVRRVAKELQLEVRLEGRRLQIFERGTAPGAQ